MKCLLSVYLTVLMGVAIFVVSGRGQSLQRGISVQMATSSHAAAMPEADNENAWIVAVTSDGRIFLGTDQVTAEGLAEQMKMRPRNRDAKLYIKADADSPFHTVRQVLHSARAVFFDDAVLLTSQPEASQPGTIVPPKGLEVWIGSEAGSNLVAVQVGSSAVKVNDEPVAPSALQGKMARIFDRRTGARIVTLRADGHVLYRQMVDAIDACRAAGASRVTIVTASEI